MNLNLFCRTHSKTITMERITENEIVGYLPYGLKVKSKRHFIKYGEETHLIINGLSKQIDGWQYEFLHNEDLKFANINEKGFLPLLRSLSDLTKEIEHNGEVIVPILEMAKNFHKNETYPVTHYENEKYFGTQKDNQVLAMVNCCVDYDSSKYTYYVLKNDIFECCSYYEIQWLLKHHFDLYGLLEKNLAINKDKIK